MRSVNIEFLRPGQIVADVVTNATGAVLCPIGYNLTDQAIQRLKNANVTAVWVEGSSKPNVDVHSRLAALESRFSGINDPVLLEIKNLLKKRMDAIAEAFGG